MQPLHEVRDMEKLERLVRSLERDGWQGSPLVIWGDQLITGSHRYAAAKALDWTDCEIPVIDLEDVFAEAGLDLDALHAEYGCPTIDEYDFVALMNELPVDVMDKYGIDIH